MGNSALKEALQEADGSRLLDLSRKLTPQEYVKHVNGECIDGSLLYLPSDCYRGSISMVESVIVSFNFIGEIPEHFGLYIPHLKYLDISHNQLSCLPESFQLLLHLRSLDVSYNRLRILPDCIVLLPKLKILNVSYNKINELPFTISKMQKLKKLNVSYNSIRALPNSLADCPNLKLIVTIGNDLIHPSQSLCAKGSEEILLFLRKCCMSSPAPRKKVTQNVFVRVRGQQVLASVSNPDSALTEYKQVQGTSRGNKRKCPLMPPAEATTLGPDTLKDILLGLVFGAVISDALALNTEGLTEDECHFFYEKSEFSLSSRIHDFLRCHYPPRDWSCNVDIMLLTLDSLMRWGGVVDELEFASLLHQWKIQGFVEIDPMPGHLISELVTEVLAREGYSANPHAVSESVMKLLKSENSGKEMDAIITSDNSCLPSALVLGIPNFYKSVEVVMNAERICMATSYDPKCRSASIFISLIIASLLKGTFSENTDMEGILLSLKEEAVQFISGDIEKMHFLQALEDNFPLHDLPWCHCYVTLNLVIHALKAHTEKTFAESVLEIVMRGGKGVTAHACVIGGILGALKGYQAIPMHWLNQLPEENRRWLNVKMNALLDLFGLP